MATRRRSKRSSTPERKRGGRPRVRTGDEVQVTVEFPQLEFARLCGYVHRGKETARCDGTPVAVHSQKYALLHAWRTYWQALPAKERQAIVQDEAFQRALRRG